MSSLYGRTSKPFEHKATPICDPSNFFKSKGKALKRDFDDFSFDSDEDETIGSTKERKTGGNVVDLDVEEDNFEAQVQARVKALTQNIVDNVDLDDDVVVLDDTPGKDTKHSRAAKALIKKIGKAVKGPTPKKGKKAAAEAAAAAVAQLNSPEVIELDLPRSSVRLPQRSVVATHAVDISLDRMQKLAGTSASVASVASSSGALSRPEPQKPQCKLKTRLNGQHERKWRICSDESFGKLRGKFAAIYGLQVSDVKFHFDGEVVKDSETPQSLDMEDDNMIDVTVEKSLYARAMAAADSALGAAPVPERPSIRLRTRLNGSHEWKWKVPVDDTFDKLRHTFCEVYGIKASEVRFEFDGDAVKDSHTPQSLDMENDNMIDAKVDKTLFASAVASANAKK